jgi:hypothetical protein
MPAESAHCGSGRTYIADARGDGRYLRCSWHGERRAFVLSTWEGSSCTGAIQLGVAEAAALAEALLRGIAAAAAEVGADRAVAAAPGVASRRSTRDAMRQLGATTLMRTRDRFGRRVPSASVELDEGSSADVATVRWLDDRRSDAEAP